ncbi:MAG: ABC transporter permease subunit, partial [Zoogloea sp.]|nr:ABC transporter permease subunit [Zoogloea sp.]
MSYQWNWGIFLSPAASGDSTYLGWMLSGLQTTILLSLSAWVIALALGSLMGVLRTVPGKWLSGLAATYVEIFRNIPLLVQLFIWYFVLPEVLPFGLGDRFKQDL